jgi:hypothetical protein
VNTCVLLGVLSGLTGLSLTGQAQTGPIPYTAVVTATKIRNEALAANSTSMRPLPLIGNWNASTEWNVGTYADGYSPQYQMQLIDQGYPLLPWFTIPLPETSASASEWIRYYEAPMKRAAALGLPISFVGTQWEERLYQLGNCTKYSLADNPCIVSRGIIQHRLSPFGAASVWRAMGRTWTASPMMAKLQEWHPTAPAVFFVSNNEGLRMNWNEVEQDDRYIALYGYGRSDEFKRKVTGDAWASLYRAFQAGMRDGLTQATWKSGARFIAFNAFGPSYFGRWFEWKTYSLATNERVDPAPVTWDGGSPPYYLSPPLSDLNVFGPQVEGMNWVFMQTEAQKLNPKFWFEVSLWDGHWPAAPDGSPGGPDSWQQFQQMGQPFTPQRYAGMTKYALWLLTPRVMREYRFHYESRTNIQAYTQVAHDAVQAIHKNSTLQQFWRSGALVANTAVKHPYSSEVPATYAAAPRWFNLSTNRDPAQPWSLYTEVPVFSVARVLNSAPKRTWLVFAYAPKGPFTGVQITLPGYGPIRMDVSVSGSCVLVDEARKTVTPVAW